jgi:predicted DNA binding CopG/RHH family protein
MEDEALDFNNLVGFDWDEGNKQKNPTFARLKLSTRTVSIRLPESLIAELKTLANKKDVPYQSLVKNFLYEKVKEENARYVDSSSS